MKSFIKSFFNHEKEYIGLLQFSNAKKNAMPPIKKEVKTVEKTALTGLIRRIG